MTENPFASPLADPYGASPSGPERTDRQYREGSVLVHEIGADFPSRCVKCNVPVGGERIKRNLSWHSPGLYVLIVFPGVLIYAIVALIVRKTAVVHVGVCDRHRTKRRNAILIGWVGFFAGFAALVVAIGDRDSTYALLGGALILGALVVAVVGTQIVTPRRIDDRYVRLNGVCKAYLDELSSRLGAEIASSLDDRDRARLDRELAELD